MAFARKIMSVFCWRNEIMVLFRSISYFVNSAVEKDVMFLVRFAVYVCPSHN